MLRLAIRESLRKNHVTSLASQMHASHQFSNLLVVRGFASERNIIRHDADRLTEAENGRILRYRSDFTRRNKLRANGEKNTDKKHGLEKDQRVPQDQFDEKLQPLFLHLSNLLASYQKIILKDFDQRQINAIKQKHGDGLNVIPDVLDQAERFHALCTQKSNVDMSWSKILESEILFKDLCRAMQKSIDRTISLRDSQGYVAEKLFRIFLDIRGNRAILVSRFKPKDQPKSFLSLAKSWLFNSSSEEDQNIRITAHEDASFAPLKRHVDDIMGVVSNDVPQDTNDVSVLEQHADRLTSILDLYSEDTPSVKSMMCVLRAQMNVGNLERADEAQRIWRRIASDLPSAQLFHQVLRAYEFASTREDDPKARANCIHEIERLVLEEWRDTEINNSSKGKSFSIAIKAMSGVGVEILPDSCERAENLAIKYLGVKSFAKLFINPDESSIQGMEMMSLTDLQLVRNIAELYSKYPDSRRLEQGMQLLRFLELQHELRKSGEKKIRRGRKGNKASAASLSDAQWLATYRSMIIGIRNYTFSPHRKEKDKTPDSQQNVNLATYAHGLLDRMEAVSVSPDSDILVRLLKIWRRVRYKKSGEYGEEVLSKLQIREAYDPSVQVTKDVYKSVLYCWNEAALAGHPEAAKRVNYILRSMEAQSGIQELKAIHASSDIDGAVYDTSYKIELRPSIHTYNHAINICGQVRSGLEKMENVNIALDIHRRILDVGFQPTTKTYLALFKCLKTHLHKNSPLRISAAEEILRLAKGKQEMLDPTVIQALKDLDSSLHKNYLDAIAERF